MTISDQIGMTSPVLTSLKTKINKLNRICDAVRLSCLFEDDFFWHHFEDDCLLVYSAKNL